MSSKRASSRALRPRLRVDLVLPGEGAAVKACCAASLEPGCCRLGVSARPGETHAEPGDARARLHPHHTHHVEISGLRYAGDGLASKLKLVALIARGCGPRYTRKEVHH